MSNEVAIIAPPRLPYHAAIEQRFGVDKAAWKALVEAVFPSAKTTDAVILALSYCKARKLDPFKRCVHIVPIWDNNARAYTETVWPGIAEHRITAMRTGLFGGADPAAFGETVTRTFSGETKNGAINVAMEFPAWCQMTLYRMVDGQRCPVPGPRVYWLETFSKLGKANVPNDRWQRAPFQMIEKCAEAAALRRAFPEEYGDEHTAEEIGVVQRDRAANDAELVRDTPRPTRAEVRAGKAAPVVDADTGEVVREPTEAEQREADRMMRQANGEDLGELEETDPTVRNMATPLRAIVPPDNKNGRPDWTAYAELCLRAIESLSNKADLEAWYAANKPGIDKSPPGACGDKIRTAFMAREEALSNGQ